MTNAALQAAIADFGPALCYIMLDNSEYICFNYPWSYKRIKDVSIETLDPSMIKYKSFGGIDFFGIPAIDITRSEPIEYIKWHRTDCIQCIGSMAEGFENKRIELSSFIR